MSSADELAHLQAEYTHLMMLAVAASTYVAEALAQPDCDPDAWCNCRRPKPSRIAAYKHAAGIVLDIHAAARRSGFRL